jgi:hypothetical protein
VRPEAFATAEQSTPRQLLQRIDAHVRACLDAGVFTELTRLDQQVSVAAGRAREGGEPAAFAALDSRFEELRARADVATALDHQKEGLMMPPLLRAGIEAWIAERGPAVQDYEPDPPPSSNPPLHAGLRRTVDERIDAQTGCAFRAIAHPNARATQTRLKRAIQQSGIDQRDDDRRLVVLRQDDWPSGQKTNELVEDFTRRGGVRLGVDLDDLRTFEALRELLREKDSALPPWLVARQPVSTSRWRGRSSSG